MPLGNTFANIWAEAHCSQIAYQDRCPVFAADGNGGEIVQRTEIAETANDVVCAAQVKNAAADLTRAHLYLVDDGRQRNAIGKQLVGIKLYLILLYEAADAGDLSHSRHGLQRIAQMPVLQATQVGETVLAALVDDGILIDPACTCCIGTNGRMHVLRQTPADLLQVLDHTRSSPVDVRSVLKNDIDVGIAQHGLCANSFDMRGSQQTGNDRVSHLVFDHIGRLACPTRVNDHLHVGDIR